MPTDVTPAKIRKVAARQGVERLYRDPRKEIAPTTLQRILEKSGAENLTQVVRALTDFSVDSVRVLAVAGELGWHGRRKNPRAEIPGDVLEQIRARSGCRNLTEVVRALTDHATGAPMGRPRKHRPSQLDEKSVSAWVERVARVRGLPGEVVRALEVMAAGIRRGDVQANRNPYDEGPLR